MSEQATVKSYAISLNTTLTIQGTECNVIITGDSASEVHDHLAGLLGNAPEQTSDAPEKPKKPAPKKSAPKKDKAPEPTETAQQTDSAEDTAPEKDAGNSATETATPSVKVEELIDKAKELLAAPDGEKKLGAIVKKHGASRISTVAEEKRGAAYQDICDALGGDEDEGGLL